MKEYSPDTKEWWAANSCIQQMEKVQNFHNYMSYMKKYDELKRTSDIEIARLKAKLFDMIERYSEQ